MRIAVQGCCHGALDKIYSSILQKGGADLLLICGDFQAIRNAHDLSTMSVPEKYKTMGNFYEYYSGKKQAPVPTIFIGGNHEASNYMHELFYGGWVAPNIYYMGNAGVVNFGGLRIAGMSGIYNAYNYENGYFERHPLQGGDIKTVYKVRRNAFMKLSLFQQPVDVVLSHDWPLGITKYGNLKGLLKVKRFLKEEIKDNTLGSPPAEKLLGLLKPKYWFSAHLHVRFEATVVHKKTTNPDEIDIEDSSSDEESRPSTTVKNQKTYFLSLDKCLPNRKFLEIMEVDCTGPKKISLDREWIAILRVTEPYTFFERVCGATPTHQELLQKVQSELNSMGDVNLEPPKFRITVPFHNPSRPDIGSEPVVYKNPQTEEFCQQIGIACRINPDGVVPEVREPEVEFDADLEEAKKRALKLLERFS